MHARLKKHRWSNIGVSHYRLTAAVVTLLCLTDTVPIASSMSSRRTSLVLAQLCKARGWEAGGREAS